MSTGPLHPSAPPHTAAPAVSPMRGPFVAAGVALAGFALVAAVDPSVPGRYPTCPFLAVTGWFCPLCGGLRATHALSRLDVGGAFAFNPLVPPLLLALVVGSLIWVRRARAGGPSYRWPPWFTWAVLGVSLAFLVLRNLPPLTWLRPPM